MKRRQMATAEHELPVYFAAGKNQLFGILTQPVGESLGTVAVVLGAGSLASSSARNRLLVRLCRRLGAAGYHAFRFDYHGAGESTGAMDRFFRLDEPFTGDLDAAITWLRAHGMPEFLLVGWCFGARTALTYAPRIRDLQGLVLVSPPVFDGAEPGADITWLASKVRTSDVLRHGFRPWVIRDLLDRGRRRKYARFALAKLRLAVAKIRRSQGARAIHVVDVSPRFLQPLQLLAARRVPMLFVYGTGDQYFDDFQQAMHAFRDEAENEAPPPIEVVTVSGQLHHVPSVSVQEAALKAIEEWVHAQAVAARVRAEAR